jgi:predicted DNA-binding transcriptional regulator AlpA
MTDDIELFSEDQIAKRFGLSVATLANWRAARRGPIPTKIGRRSFYSRDAINAWLLKREGTYASEPTVRANRAAMSHKSAKSGRK